MFQAYLRRSQNTDLDLGIVAPPAPNVSFLSIAVAVIVVIVVVIPIANTSPIFLPIIVNVQVDSVHQPLIVETS